MLIQYRFFVSIFVLLVFCFHSCSTQEAKDKGNIAIDVNRNDRVSLSDIVEKIELFPLETNKDSWLSFPLGEPDKVVRYNGDFYFLDKDQDVIFVFDPEGMFLKRIDRKGRGPGEYISIYDFNINRFTNNLEILSSESRCIYVYDLETLRPVETIRFPADLPALHLFHNLTSDVYVLISRAKSTRLFFYHWKDGKTVESDYSLPEWFTRNTVYGSSINPFYVFNDELCFEQIYNGEVFTVSSETYELLPRYGWDMGEHNFSPSVLPENESMEYYSKLGIDISMKYANLFQVYQENSRYYITRFKFRNRYKHLIYKKDTSDYLLFETFEEGGQFVPQWSDNEAFYTFVSPIYMNWVISESMLDEENRRIFLGIKEDDNPLIIKYKLK